MRSMRFSLFSNGDAIRRGLRAIAIAIACFLLLAGNAAAADKRVCICGDSCQCAPGVCPGKCPVQFVSGPTAGHYEQRCNGKRCYSVWVPDVPAPPASAPAVCESCQSAPVNEGFHPFEGLRERFQNRPRIFEGRILDRLRR